ncbi:hypothetical protein IGK73_000490 [Enterococcus sp. AZ102]
MNMKKYMLAGLMLSAMLLPAVALAEETGAVYTSNGAVTFTANTDPTKPVDPLNPENPITPTDPTNPDENGNPGEVTPGTAGPLSIDFASSLQFGEQKITSTTETYYAATQKYTTKDGTATEGPNYVQVTDNRGTEKGWVLKVKQNGQFKNTDGKELVGAKITLNQGNVVTNSSSTKPVGKEIIELTPASDTPDSENYGAESIVMNAEKGGGAGTYLHAWGSDAETAAKSIALEVPGSTTKYATQYTTTFTWILSEIPEN